MWEKLKTYKYNETVFMSVLILLVSVASFGLGRKSVADDLLSTRRLPAQLIESQTKSVPAEPITTKTAGVEAISVVASRSGTKYHLPDCPGAAQIKAENKITFSSIEEAKAAGYAPASNCPGLAAP